MAVRLRIVPFLLIVLLMGMQRAQGERPTKLYKEETTIQLQKNSISVHGLYFFENRSDFELDVTITYPFPISISQLFPERIELLDPSNALEFEKREKGIQWSQHFEPSGIETVLVAFTQTIKQEQATYILKKKFWNDKVDKIHLVIEAPLDFENMSISIEPDSSITDENKRYFYFTKHYFAAKQNLIITWE